MSRTRLAAYYAVVFAALGAQLPFVPLVLAARGLSARAVGGVLVVGPVLSVLAPPLWAWAADTFGIRARLMSLAPVGCALGVLMFIPDAGVLGALGAMFIVSACRSPMVPMADAATYAVLEGDAAGFARVRVWGSVGFVIAAALLGWFDGSQHLGLLFGAAAVAYVIAALLAASGTTAWQPKRSGVARAALREVRERALLPLFIGSVLYSLGHGSYDAFIGLHLHNLGYGDRIVGLAWTAGVVAEIVLMLFVRPVIERIAGARLLVLAGLVAALRWMLLSWVTSAIAVVAVQLLHAITFGLWYLSMVGFVQTRASESLRTSVQSLAHASMAGGMVVGYVVGGEVFEREGGTWLFRMAAVAALGATLAYGVLARRNPGSTRHG